MVGDVQLKVMRADFSGMEVVPLTADSALAAAMEPNSASTAWIEPPISVGPVSAIRIRMEQLGVILRVAEFDGSVAVAIGQDWSWRYADPAHALFGQSCDAVKLCNPAGFLAVGTTALLVETESAAVLPCSVCISPLSAVNLSAMRS